MAINQRYRVALDGGTGQGTQETDGGTGGATKQKGSLEAKKKTGAVGSGSLGIKAKTGSVKSGNAYNPASIVDYLKMNGQDSSYAARKKLAEQNGITGYSGTADQNARLLGLLRNGGGQTAVTDVGAGRAAGKIGEAGTAVPAQEAADAVAGGLRNMESTMAGQGTAADTGTAPLPAAVPLAAANPADRGSVPVDAFKPVSEATQFQASEAYNRAMDYTNTLLSQMSSGRTSYTDQIERLLGEYQGRDAFSYDPEGDAMFQQMLAQSMASGKTAMQDAMGQAAALTGGYGSSYGTAVGNNVYAQYLQDAYAQMPDYYRLALDAYNQEGQKMLNELGILADADAKEYARLLDAYSANARNVQDMYSREYGAWQDAQSQSNYENQFAYQQYLDKLSQGNYEREFAYQQSQDAQSQKNYEEQFAYQKYLDGLSQGNYERELAYQQSQDAQSQKNYEEQFAYQKYLDGLSQGNYERELAYKQSQDAQSQKNYEEQFAYQKYLDGVAAQNSAAGGTLSEVSDSVKRKALEEYEKYGDEGLMRFVASVDGGKYNQEGIYDYALTYGKTPIGKEEFTKTKDTTNWFWGIDNDDLVEFGGKEMKISQVQERLEQYYVSLGDTKSEAKKKAKEAAKQLTGLKKGEKLRLPE